MVEKILLNEAGKIFDLSVEGIKPLPGHDGGRNKIYRCAKGILRIAKSGDRTPEDYLAEAEFVHYLALNGAPVADIKTSIRGRFVEQIEIENKIWYVCQFDYAKGMLIAENGYRYRQNVPLSEYFYNTGKTLGKIHKLSKNYHPVHKRSSFFEKYNMNYIDSLVDNQYLDLKRAIAEHLAVFHELPEDRESFGLIHFDFSDGNYHIDMETGAITVFDFDNCMYCWYMFDLANLWVHGWGWCMFESDIEKRKVIMGDYFDAILRGYQSETNVSEEMLQKLPLFINMVLIENIVDEFECSRRNKKEVVYEDIEDAAECLINKIPYAGYFTD